MIQLNGNKVSGCEGITVEELICRQKFDKSRIAIEINGSIVSKQDYSSTKVREGDVIEVVSFVGGG